MEVRDAESQVSVKNMQSNICVLIKSLISKQCFTAKRQFKRPHCSELVDKTEVDVWFNVCGSFDFCKEPKGHVVSSTWKSPKVGRINIVACFRGNSLSGPPNKPC